MASTLSATRAWLFKVHLIFVIFISFFQRVMLRIPKQTEGFVVVVVSRTTLFFL